MSAREGRRFGAALVSTGRLLEYQPDVGASSPWALEARYDVRRVE